MKISKKAGSKPVEVPWPEMLEQVLRVTKGLSEWEIKFIESLAKDEKRQYITERQYRKLEEIWLDHC